MPLTMKCDSAGSRITGWGTALPDKTITNADLEARLDTSDVWIRERTGIGERRIGHSTREIAVRAGRQAMDRAGVTGADIDMVVLCTMTPDQAMPATSAAIQEELQIAGGAFDVNAACAGFVYGLITVDGMLHQGLRRVLLIGSETMSRLVDWEDRNTAVLFGDGAGALVLEATSGQGSLLSFDLGADGSSRSLLYADLGDYMRMDGKELFRRAVRAVVESSGRAMERAGVTADEIALMVPHQANTRIIDAACGRMGIPLDKTVNVLERTANTSAASVPLALADALDSARVSEGDKILFSGFGAGMTWASAIWQWHETPRSAS